MTDKIKPPTKPSPATKNEPSGGRSEPDCSASFTPGPWSFVDGVDPGDKAIRSASNHWICLCFNEQPNRGDCEPNGLLIAAAPDLLASLQRLVAAEYATMEEFEEKQINELEASMKQARTVIATALGQNSPAQPPKVG